MKRSTNRFFQQFFQQNYDALVRFLAAKYTNTDEAQDLAQDAFYKVMKVENAEELEHARAYLFQTAANLALNRIRKQKRQDLYQQSAVASESDGSIASPERANLARQQLQQVEQALASLPKKCRMAFVMHRSRNMNYQQIATELGVSVSTVEKYMIAALEQCRSKVNWGNN